MADTPRMQITVRQDYGTAVDGEPGTGREAILSAALTIASAIKVIEETALASGCDEDDANRMANAAIKLAGDMLTDGTLDDFSGTISAQTRE